MTLFRHIFDQRIKKITIFAADFNNNKQKQFAYRNTSTLITKNRDKMKNLTDDQLIALYAEGVNEAFDELLFRYKEKLYTYIYLIVQNRELTEDLFQDTFTKVIVTIKSGHYDEKGRFLGFLFRVAHNLIADIYRKEQNAQYISPTEAGYDIFNNCAFSDPSREEEITNSQIMHDVRHLIKFLPENQQEIVLMRFYKGLSFKRIAELKNISINTALGRLRYAVLNLRRMAEEHNISLVG